MTLNKRYARNIKKNLSFYICVCLLTILVVVLYLDFDAGTQKFGRVLDRFYEKFRVEDAQFTTVYEIDEAAIEELEKKYDILIEKQRYADFELDDYTVRVVDVSKKINMLIPNDSNAETGEPVTNISDGSVTGISSSSVTDASGGLVTGISDESVAGISDKPNIDNEESEVPHIIMFNTGLMEGNNIKKGDIIELGGMSFTFTGGFERPDYLFPIKDTSDTYALKNEFGIAVVSDEDFEYLSKASKDSFEYYSIIYNSDNEAEVRKAINREYTMLSYLNAQTNTRISTPLLEVEETANMMHMVILVLVIFVSVIISVVIGRRIKNDRRQIGVLIALGYRKRELIKHYAFYGLYSGLIGTVIGVIISCLFSNKLIQYLFFKIEPIPISYQVSLPNILIAVIVPTLMYTFSVYRSAAKVMKTDVITMISGRSQGREVSRLRMKKSHLKTKTKYKLRQIFGKPGRSIIVIIGMAFGGMLYAFCITCIDSMDDYVKHTVDQIGSFEYEYFLKSPELGEPEEGDAIYGASFEVKGRDDMIMLLGIDSPRLINFTDNDGNELQYDEDHYYITSMASLAYGAGVGDEISFVDPITLDEYTVKVTDVIKNDSQAAIYCSRENAIELLKVNDNMFSAANGMIGMRASIYNLLHPVGEEELLPYNIIMSDKELDMDSDDLVKTISKTSLADQINEVKTNMENLMEIIDVFAVLICVIVVYMMVNVLMTEASSSVSMLKVLGYRNKEINSMVLNVYHFLVPIAIVISFLLGFFGTKAVFTANVSVYKTYLATLIYPISVVKMTALIVISYGASLMLLRGKAGKVDLVESLKDNRE